MSKIPFVDLKAQYQRIKTDIDAAMQEVVDNTAFIGGQKLKDFEAAFAEYCGAKHVVGMGSGTAALMIGLSAMGIGKGDEVITTPHTFIATAEAISHVGATIKFVDIDPKTYNLDPAKIEAAITKNTKAILPVHLYGQMADMDAIMQIAEKHNLLVLEDTAQAVGAKYKDKMAGTVGHAAAFSFYPGKNLGAYGDAGALITNNDEYAKKARMIANHGRLTKYEHEFEGVSSRMDGLQAAILAAKLPHIDTWNAERRQVAEYYAEFLGPFSEKITLPYVPDGLEAVYHLYVIRVEKRDELLNLLKENNISGGIHYPVPLHEQPAYQYLGHQASDFAETSRAAQEIASLPMFPEMTQEMVRRVSEVVAEHVSTL